MVIIHLGNSQSPHQISFVLAPQHRYLCRHGLIRRPHVPAGEVGNQRVRALLIVSRVCPFHLFAVDLLFVRVAKQPLLDSVCQRVDLLGVDVAKLVEHQRIAGVRVHRVKQTVLLQIQRILSALFFCRLSHVHERGSKRVARLDQIVVFVHPARRLRLHSGDKLRQAVVQSNTESLLFTQQIINLRFAACFCPVGQLADNRLRRSGYKLLLRVLRRKRATVPLVDRGVHFRDALNVVPHGRFVAVIGRLQNRVPVCAIPFSVFDKVRQLVAEHHAHRLARAHSAGNIQAVCLRVVVAAKAVTQIGDNNLRPEMFADYAGKLLENRVLDAALVYAFLPRVRADLANAGLHPAQLAFQLAAPVQQIQNFRLRVRARLVGLRVLQCFPAVVKRHQPRADLVHPRVELAKRFLVHSHGFRFRIALRRRVEFFFRRLLLRVELRNLVVNGLHPRFPVVKHGFPRRRVLRDDGLSARLSRLCQPLCRRLLHFVRSARGDRALLVRGFLVFAHAHARLGHFLLPRQVAVHHCVARFRELRPAVVRRRLRRFRLCARLVGLLLGLCRVRRASALVLPADDFLGNGLAFLLLSRIVVEQRAGLLVAQRLCHVQDDVLYVRPLAVHQVLRRLHAAQRAHAASRRAGQGEQHRADGVLHRV